MPMEFDAVSKYLLDTGPGEWLALSGRKTSAPLTHVVSDLSTVTANADKFFRVEEHPPWLVNFEPFSSRDKTAPQRVCLYSILGLAKLELPVLTVVNLLSKRADGPEWKKSFSAKLPGEERPYLHFEFSVLRIWEVSPEILLEGGIATLALAPISKIGKNEVSGLMREIFARVEAEIPPEERRNYLAAMSTLMGLRYPADFVAKLFKDFSEMRESSVVQLWLNEGREEGREEGLENGQRRSLLTVLEAQFGEIPDDLVQQVAGITDIDQLDLLVRSAVTDRSLKAFLKRIK
jgi:predicted transposase YdaD